MSAHAGVDPGKGVSAIRELARQIIAVEALHDLDRGVSVNVGVVSGGTRPNVVPEEAIAIVDVRAPTLDDAARIDAAFKALRPILPGARLVVTGGLRASADGAVRWRDCALRTRAGGSRGARADDPEGGTGGGSDGNLTAALGVPTLDGLGGVGDGAHAIHEHVELDKLVPRTALLAALNRSTAVAGRHAAAALIRAFAVT